ncbi:MAG: LuxR C-terminal-related transcriptional regulator, partial [Nocardioidaceae bacterium]
DLHWADEASLEFLLELIADPHGPGVLATYRPDEVQPGSLLRRLSSGLPAGTARERVDLQPFTLEETTELMSAMLDGRTVSSEFAAAMYQKSEGLPLAVEETMRLLEAKSALVLRGGAWCAPAVEDLGVPPMLRDRVLERVHWLLPEAQHVLEVAAVLAEDASVETVGDVARLPLDEVYRGLRQCLDARLLEEDERGGLSFRHVMAAQAVYEWTPGYERRALHLSAARRLESSLPLPLARLVFHFQVAGETARWARYGERAADTAISTGDDATGVALLNELASCPELDPATRYAHARKLAHSGVFRRAVDHDLLSSVAATLAGVIALDGLTEAERAELRSPRGRLLMQMGEFEPGRAELSAAVPHLGENPAEATRALVYLGWPYGSRRHAVTHLEWLRRAAALQPGSLSVTDRLSLVVDRLTSLLLLGDGSGWALAESLPTEYDGVNEGLQLARGHGNAAHVAMLWGRYDKAEWHLEHALRLAASVPFERLDRPILATQAHLDWLLGRWLGLRGRAERLATGDGERLPQLEAGLVLDLLAGHEGSDPDLPKRLASLRGEMEQRQVSDLLGPCTAALADCYLGDDRVGEALEVTASVVEEITVRGVWLWATEVVPVRVGALLGGGRWQEASRLVAAFARGIAGVEAPGPQAALLHSRALLIEARAGRPLVAAAAFERAAAAWAELPRPLWAALARERRAVALVRAGDQESAVALLEAVHTDLIDLGAVHDARSVGGRLREIKGSPAHAVGRPGYGDRLSPREHDVVRLLVEGHTNREIGERLVLSPKTVARHLESARRKFKAGSRTALAVMAVERGIVDTSSDAEAD